MTALPGSVRGMNGPVPGIDIVEFERVLRSGVTLIDVREQDEYLEARVGGGLLMPLQTVADRLDEFPRDTPVYVICATGGRSHRAAAFLREQGVNAINVLGGTAAWQAAGFSVERGPDADRAQ